MNRKRMPKPSRPFADKRRRLLDEWRAVRLDPCFCDHCGAEPEMLLPVSKLPCDIASACKGESAHLCSDCHERFIAGR